MKRLSFLRSPKIRKERAMSRIRWRGVLLSALALGASVAAMAGPGGGAHGGGGGGFHGGGYAGGYGGYHGGYAWHGAYGWPGYGWRGGYGWGYGWRGYYGGWWGPWGVGLGLYLPLLPWYYSTYWWNGVPYYYADGSYYQWNNTVNQYEAVAPPQGLSQAPSQAYSGTGAGPAVSPTLFAYPKAGQSPAQQAQDRSECEQWARAQSGFDPTKPAAVGTPVAPGAREGYLRAQAACLEGRNYSVR
jgi:hypothetical protein